MQKIKRIIKKIGAISTGAVFLGATLMGAMAADLSTYPDPFVKGGAANNAIIAYSANNLDTTAAGYILTGLSGAVTATTGATVTSVEGGYKMEYSGNKFNLNDTAYDIDQKLSKTQMPVILKKETFSDVEGTNTGDFDYKQELLFRNRGSETAEKTVWLIYDQDDNDNDKPMGEYLYLSKSSGAWAYSYLLDFDSTPTVKDSADLAANKIKLLGKDFTISSATVTAYNVTKLTMLAGEVTQVVSTGSTVSGVKLSGVDSNGASCTIEYDGITYTINNGATRTMPDGTIIGVTKVTPIDDPASPDYCELNIGASKVELENGKEVKVNGDKITGSTVEFSKGFDYVNVSYKPEEKKFLKKGEEFEDPVFGAFKIIYANFVDEDQEEIKLTASGEKVDLTAINKDGDTNTWTIAFANTTGTGDVMPGADKDEPFISLEGDFVTNTTMGESELSGMSGIRFLFSMNDRSHIVKIKSINTLDNKTTFYDETTQTEYSDQEWTSNTSTTFTFMPSNFQLTFGRATEYPNGINAAVLGNDVIRFNDITDKGASYMLKGGGNVTFNSNWSGGTGTGGGTGEGIAPGLPTDKRYWMTFGEVDTGKETNMLLNTIGINFTYDTTNQEINIAAITANADFAFKGTGTTLKQKDKSDTTVKAGRTRYGTYVEQITPTGSGTDSVTIKTPDTASSAEVWISPIGATVSTEGAVATGIDLKSEDEITDIAAYNAIVVGGPAANKIAANLLGLTYPAYGEASGLSEGEAILKLVDNGANVALLVFGWEKDDTTRAAKVLQNYDAYTLSGSEASVTGTTANPTIAE